MSCGRSTLPRLQLYLARLERKHGPDAACVRNKSKHRLATAVSSSSIIGPYMRHRLSIQAAPTATAKVPQSEEHSNAVIQIDFCPNLPALCPYGFLFSLFSFSLFSSLNPRSSFLFPLFSVFRFPCSVFRVAWSVVRGPWSVVRVAWSVVRGPLRCVLHCYRCSLSCRYRIIISKHILPYLTLLHFVVPYFRRYG